VGGIWVEKGGRISVEMKKLDGGPSARGERRLERPRQPLSTAPMAAGGPPLEAVARKRGWHRLTLRAKTPSADKARFTVAIAYAAPRSGPKVAPTATSIGTGAKRPRGLTASLEPGTLPEPCSTG